MKARVLVVGATGFVGRNVITALQERPDVETIAACRRPTPLPAHLRASARVGDLTDPAYRATVFNDVDVVCLVSAWSALYGHRAESRVLFYEPMRAAIDAAAEAGVRRIVLASANEVGNIDSSVYRAVRKNVDSVWPHLANVRRLERHLAEQAGPRLSGIVLRFGAFVGAGVNLGLLPILLPRLAAGRVPYVGDPANRMRLIAGKDIGRAFARAAVADVEPPFSVADIVAQNLPTFAEFYSLLHEYGYPKPRFTVSGRLAFAFARVAELIGQLSGRDPLLTRSIVLLGEPFPLRNDASLIGFSPQVPWRRAVREQVKELQAGAGPGRLADPVPAVKGIS